MSLFTTRYNRWATEVRETLFQNLEFTPVAEDKLLRGQFPKLGALHVPIFQKVFGYDKNPVQLALSSQRTENFIFYQEATRYWAKATVGLPFYAKDGKIDAPAHGRYLFLRDAESADAVCALLNSSVFYSYFVGYGDCFHLSDGLATGFSAAPSAIGDQALGKLSQKLMKDLKSNANRKEINTKDGAKISYDEFNVSQSKPLIDEIDRLLAKHYGFTEEELDYIINYDIKYRMGANTEEVEE